MKYSIVLLLTIALANPAFAQGPFDQVHQIEAQQKQAVAAERAERDRQNALLDERRAAEWAAERKAQRTAQQNSQRRAAEANKVRNIEQQRLRSRSEKIEDEANALELEERKLKLQTLKAKAARTDDYIDAELKERAAKTDVIQSNADATRDVSSGTRSLLQDTGKADVNRSNKLFGN